MSEPYFTQGHVVLTGKVDGSDVTLEGDITDTYIEVEHKYEDVNSDFAFNSLRFLSEQVYTLKFKTDYDGHAYTYTVKDRTVRRTAEIEVAGRTAKAVEEARVAAGVPEDATFIIQRQVKDAAKMEFSENAIFEWQEKVLPHG